MELADEATTSRKNRSPDPLALHRWPLYALETPLGWFGAAFEDQRLVRLWLQHRELADLIEHAFQAPYEPGNLETEEKVAVLRMPRGELTPQGFPPVKAMLEDLLRYASGDVVEFRPEQWALPDVTPFQQEVLEAAAAIPYGETMTYGALARQIGRPKAARAVGAALGANPIPIVIPCHRVLGSNGQLTGFTGGISRKEELLKLEKRLPT